jgi:hypothetical protein
MKAHLLLNILNHVHPHSEWDGGDTLTHPDGSVVSIAESAKTMQAGNSRLMPPVSENTDHSQD